MKVREGFGTMVELKIEKMDSFLNAVSVLLRFDETADLKCSPAMFSLIISRYFPRIITALQILPPFFTHFLCHQTHQSHVPIKFLYNTIVKTMIKPNSFTSITLFLPHPLNHMTLQFHNSRIGKQEFHQLPLLLSREEDVGEIDYGTFVSIDSQVFQGIATELVDFNALVTLTNSQVMFSIEAREIILTEVRNECIIGGVAAGEETRFFVILNPIIFFCDLTRQSKRIWLFKSANAYSIITAPIDLYAQFCVYFPQKSGGKKG